MKYNYISYDNTTLIIFFYLGENVDVPIYNIWSEGIYERQFFFLLCVNIIFFLYVIEIHLNCCRLSKLKNQTHYL